MELGPPRRLVSNANLSYQGSIPLGLGFILQPEEAEAWIEKSPINKEVLFPYINGEELNTHPEQKPSRWVINFFDWPLDRASAPLSYTGPVAADYPDLLEIVESLVKEERLGKAKDVAKAPWWQFWRSRNELYKSISNLDRVLVCSEVTKHSAFAFLPTGLVFSSNLDVFTFSEYTVFSILQSSIHEIWARKTSSTLETRLKYSPGNSFETFPFPNNVLPLNESNLRIKSHDDLLQAIGKRYYTHRQGVMRQTMLGLTKTYNRFHDPNESHSEIIELRRLHIELDRALAEAYGWSSLYLGHDFHETKQGLRFTVSESARQEILDRLLALNHERYAEEVASGLHKRKL